MDYRRFGTYSPYDEPAEPKLPDSYKIMEALLEGTRTPEAEKFLDDNWYMIEVWTETLTPEILIGYEDIDEWAIGTMDAIYRDVMSYLETVRREYPDEEITEGEALREYLEF